MTTPLICTFLINGFYALHYITGLGKWVKPKVCSSSHYIIMTDGQILFGFVAHTIIIVLVASEFKPFRITTPPANKNAQHNFLSLYTENKIFLNRWLLCYGLFVPCPGDSAMCSTSGSLRVQALDFTAGSWLHNGMTSSRGGLRMHETTCSVEKCTVLQAGFARTRPHAQWRMCGSPGRLPMHETTRSVEKCAVLQAGITLTNETVTMDIVCKACLCY